MTPALETDQEYIGDAVYAIYDGYGVWLRTSDHREQLCDQKVYLEPPVIVNFLNWLKKIKAKGGEDS